MTPTRKERKEDEEEGKIDNLNFFKY